MTKPKNLTRLPRMAHLPHLRYLTRLTHLLRGFGVGRDGRSFAEARKDREEPEVARESRELGWQNAVTNHRFESGSCNYSLRKGYEVIGIGRNMQSDRSIIGRYVL